MRARIGGERKSSAAVGGQVLTDTHAADPLRASPTPLAIASLIVSGYSTAVVIVKAPSQGYHPRRVGRNSGVFAALRIKRALSSSQIAMPQTTTAWSIFVAATIIALVTVIVLGLWAAREALLLAFASAILSILLLAIARPIERYVGLSRRWTLPLSGLLVLGVVGAFGVTMGAAVQGQIGELRSKLPQSTSAVEQRLRELLGGREPLQERDAQDREATSEAGSRPADAGPSVANWTNLPRLSEFVANMLGNLASVGSVILGALAGVVVVIVGAFYLAADPARYRRGLTLLFPKSRQPEVDDALIAAGRALHLWLLAQLISMALVGVLVGLGAWLIGLPAPLALGLFAGLTEFVPVVGPYIGALPAVVLAASSGIDMLLWTVGLFLIVQQAESNLITPVVQEKMTDLPAFLLLFAIIALGLIFGAGGVLVAAPLTVVCYVLVQKLYVERALGHDVEVAGEKK